MAGVRSYVGAGYRCVSTDKEWSARLRAAGSRQRVLEVVGPGIRIVGGFVAVGGIDFG